MLPRLLSRTAKAALPYVYSRSAPLYRPVLRGTQSPQYLANPWRTYSGKSSIDEKIEEIQELYATATDEFEIATEETEKQTVYAADDRIAAQEELAKLNKVYEEAVKGNGGEEIKRRVGGRIRELDRAVEALVERANEQGG